MNRDAHLRSALMTASRLLRADGGPADDPAAARQPVDPGVPYIFPGPDPNRRQLNEQGLYSQAADVAARMPMQKGSPQQVKGYLLKQGVKPDEMKWSNYDAAMGSQPSVTRDQVVQHFKQALPKMDEMSLGADMTDPQAKFEQYSLPGGKNYRELGLQLRPPEDRELPKYREAYRAAVAARTAAHTAYHDAFGNMAQVLARNNQDETHPDVRAATQQWRDKKVALDAAADDVLRTHHTMGAAQAQSERNLDAGFRSNHWDDPNILLHLRLKDRNGPGPTDHKMLHLEELQSDWAQRGREEGFGLSPEEKDKYKALRQIPPNQMTPDQLRDHENLERRGWSTTPPRAPYVDSTSKWVDLGLKRALYEAAKGNYGKLLVTPGEEQAKRYDLSKHVKAARYFPEIKLLQTDLSGRAPNEHHIEPEELPNFIGKELTQRLLAQPLKSTDKYGRPHHALSGLDLRIGGEGMKAFYDRIVPQALEKLARRHDPEAKVQLHGQPINTPRQDWVSGRMVMDDMGIPEHEHRSYWAGLPWESRDELMEKYRAKQERKISKLHALTITPKMRASILKGQPAYAEGGAVPLNLAKGGAAIEDGPDQRKPELLGMPGAHEPDEAEDPNRRSNHVSNIIRRGVALSPVTRAPTPEEMMLARNDTRGGNDIVHRRLDTIVPEASRVTGGTYTPGAPGGGRWADATVLKNYTEPTGPDPFPMEPSQYRTYQQREKLADQPGRGFRVNDDELHHLWQQSVGESSQAAKDAVRTHNVRPTFSGRDWHEAMSLPLRDHLWYELSGEKMAENLPDLTASEHMKMLDVLGATSARAKPDENLERTLAVMSQHLRGAPVDTDLTIPSTVRQALARKHEGTSALPGNKTGHFSDTLALTGGIPTRFPISVNDVWVGKMFGVPDDVMSSNQSLHEPMAIYFNKLRDLYNERHGHELPFKYQSWNFQAPAWVHLRKQEGNTQEGDAYHQVWGKTIQKLKDAGVEGIEGDKITRKALMDPRFADALRRTVKPFRDAPKATVEFGTTQTPVGRRAHDLYQQALERGDQLSQNEYLKGLTTAMYASARGKNHPWDQLKRAITGDVTQQGDITRIASPTTKAPLDIGGTFEGAVSPNIRIPLQNMNDQHQAEFNAVAGRHLRQDAMAVSHILGAEHGSEPRAGYTRGHSIFVPTTDQIQPGHIRDFARQLSPHGHNLSYVRYPNGYQFDVLPAFDDEGPKGVDEHVLDEAYGNSLRPHHSGATITPHDFKSVYTERSDYGKLRTGLTNRIRNEYVEQAKRAGLPRTTALKALETPEAALAGGGKEARDVYRARIDNLTSAEQGFKDLAQRVADAHEGFIDSASKRMAKPLPASGAVSPAPQDPDAPPFAEGGAVRTEIPGLPHIDPPTARVDPPRLATGGAVDHAPTEAQKEAGNYKKKHISFQGLRISIENRKGSLRSGTDEDGGQWHCVLPADYGYIKRTEGADGDHVDVYVGPNKDSDRVYIVNQRDHRSLRFDEHKVMLGYSSEAEALKDYCDGFSDGNGEKRIASVEVMSIEAFKRWLKHDDTTAPIASKAHGGAVADPEKVDERPPLEDPDQIKERHPVKDPSIVQTGTLTPEQAARGTPAEDDPVVERALAMIHENSSKPRENFKDGGAVDVQQLTGVVARQSRMIDKLTGALLTPQKVIRDENNRVREIRREHAEGGPVEAEPPAPEINDVRHLTEVVAKQSAMIDKLTEALLTPQKVIRDEHNRMMEIRRERDK
jgi:hypothetical protein